MCVKIIVWRFSSSRKGSIEYYHSKAAALAEECQEIFMAAVLAFHTGKAFVQIAAIEIAIDYLLDIGPPESVLT